MADTKISALPSATDLVDAVIPIVQGGANKKAAASLFNAALIGEWLGPWVTATAYALNDVVSNGGSSYICVEAHTSGTFATDLAAVKWEIVAQKGDTGSTGAAGTNGTNGTNGVDGKFSGTEVIKTAAYTALAADVGKTIILNKATADTLSFDAAATLGSTWMVMVKNIGAGTWSLDPNGAETIDGAATISLAQNESVVVSCNGTALRSLFRGGGSIGGTTGSTDNRLVRSDGTGGSTVQSTGITVDDSNNVSGVASLTIDAATNITAYGLDIDKQFSGTLAGSAHGHLIRAAADVATITGANFLNMVTLEHRFGGTGFQGGRQALQVALIQEGPSDAGSSNRNYVAVTPYTQATVSDGGTGLTFANAKGAFFGINPSTIARNGATNLLDVTAGEVNVAIETGASAYKKTILSLVALATDAVSGSVIDAVLDMRKMTGAIGFNDGLLFHDMEGHAAFPIKTTGTLIRAAVNGATTVAKGIDISALTITGNAWSSPSVTITGAGVVTAPSIGVDANFRDTIVSSNPRITVDSNDYYEYSRTNNSHNFYIGGSNNLQINASAVDTPIGYAVAASYVVRSRKTGWALATGTATRTTFATGSVTLPLLAERVKALIDDLHATAGHGLIGT
jgi:hypothetical protein